MILMVETYDASETEERPRSAYLSRKDLKVAAIMMVVFSAILAPIYLYQRRQANQHVCKNNYAQIAKALTVYMEANNDRFPPIFDVDPASGEPLMVDGYASTWMTKIYSGLERRASFVCPSSSPAERAKNLNPEKSNAFFESSYGMYRVWSAYPKSMIPNPDTSIIIAETSNAGSMDTYNPIPFKGGMDGAAIGWNDSNDRPTLKTTSVTRLAFPSTKTGDFKETGVARHDNGIHALFVSLRYRAIKPSAARVTRVSAVSDQLSGLWATP